jgi:hypothetical protein
MPGFEFGFFGALMGTGFESCMCPRTRGGIAQSTVSMVIMVVEDHEGPDLEANVILMCM